MTDTGRANREYLMAWREYAHDSPLYRELIAITADSPDLLEIIGRIHGQPPPNLFLAAIQYLLMKDPAVPLAAYYESMVTRAKPVSGVAAPFREYVLDHQDRIVEIANSRYTQTNECRRCVALLPGVMASPFDQFHLIDLGTSAGLNLAMDEYHYDFGGVVWGPPSSVELACEVRGDSPRLRDIRILSRIGIDLNVVDVSDQDQRMWLDALIWPEHAERRARLRTAIEVAATIDVDLVEGDVLDVLAGVLDDVPAYDPVVIVNSFVLNQFSPDERNALADVINAARVSRRIFRVSLESIHIGDPLPHLEIGEGRDLMQLGTAHHHGDWIDLQYDQS
ncbi:MAG TPA: DUF2332 domain-containing protein [Acidimicrobiia bacterium]